MKQQQETMSKTTQDFIPLSQKSRHLSVVPLSGVSPDAIFSHAQDSARLDNEDRKNASNKDDKDNILAPRQTNSLKELRQQHMHFTQFSELAETSSAFFDPAQMESFLNSKASVVTASRFLAENIDEAAELATPAPPAAKAMLGSQRAPRPGSLQR